MKTQGRLGNKKTLWIWQETNQQIINILKRRRLPWTTGKGPGDAQAYSMHASLHLMLSLEVMPENALIFDRPDILGSNGLIVHNPLKQPTS